MGRGCHARSTQTQNKTGRGTQPIRIQLPIDCQTSLGVNIKKYC